MPDENVLLSVKKAISTGNKILANLSSPTLEAEINELVDLVWKTFLAEQQELQKIDEIVEKLSKKLQETQLSEAAIKKLQLTHQELGLILASREAKATSSPALSPVSARKASDPVICYFPTPNRLSGNRSLTMSQINLRRQELFNKIAEQQAEAAAAEEEKRQKKQAKRDKKQEKKKQKIEEKEQKKLARELRRRTLPAVKLQAKHFDKFFENKVPTGGLRPSSSSEPTAPHGSPPKHKPRGRSQTEGANTMPRFKKF